MRELLSQLIPTVRFCTISSPCTKEYKVLELVELYLLYLN
jgi:hypothetical protein